MRTCFWIAGARSARPDNVPVDSVEGALSAAGNPEEKGERVVDKLRKAIKR